MCGVCSERGPWPGAGCRRGGAGVKGVFWVAGDREGAAVVRGRRVAAGGRVPAGAGVRIGGGPCRLPPRRPSRPPRKARPHQEQARPPL
eukprot:1652473-Rhodomonas_salina.1